MATWNREIRSMRILARGEVVSVDSRRGCRIGCVAGCVWVTTAGRLADIMLAAGEEIRWSGRGRVVVEALRTATVRLELVSGPAA